MNTSPVESFSVTLQPKEQRPLQTSGRFVACTAASAPFIVNMGGHGDFPMRSGFLVPSKKMFSTVTLKNPTLAVISLTLWVGEDGISFFDNQLRQCATYLKGRGLVNLQAAGSPGGTDKLILTGSDDGNSRAQLLITNMSANQMLYLTDKDGALFAPIYPGGKPWTYATTGYAILVNTNAAPVQAIVGETFYANL